MLIKYFEDIFFYFLIFDKFRYILIWRHQWIKQAISNFAHKEGNCLFLPEEKNSKKILVCFNSTEPSLGEIIHFPSSIHFLLLFN